MREYGIGNLVGLCDYQKTIKDPYFANVILLIQPTFNALAGSQSILDRSPIGRSLSVYGNAQISLLTGYPTVLLDGTGDCISFTNSSEFDFTSTSTIEVLFTKTSLSKSEGIYCKRAYGVSSVAWDIMAQTDGSVGFSWYNAGNVSGQIYLPAGSVVVGVQNHLEVARDVYGIVRVYFNGVYIAQGDMAANPVGTNAYSPIVGRQPNTTTRDFSGHIRVRHTLGVARHTTQGSFTPPVQFEVA